MTDLLKKLICGNKKALAVTICISGLVLIGLSYFQSKGTTKQKQESQYFSPSLEYSQICEGKLEKILKPLFGKDSFDVTVTCDQSTLLQYDSSSEDYNNLSSPYTFDASYTNTHTHTIKGPTVEKVLTPKVRGVIITTSKVIQEDFSNQIKKATSVALDISYNQIYIFGGDNNENTP